MLRNWLLALVVSTSGLASLAAEAAERAPAGTAAVVIDAAQYPDLQAALDAVPASGGLVRLPPGDFRLMRPLVLTQGNTRIEGAGDATRLINANGEGQPALIVRPADLEKNPKARLWRVQLASFRICGDPDAVNGKSTRPKSGDGLLAQNVDELYLHGLSADHNGGHGVHLINCLEDARIADSIFTYNAQTGVTIVGGHDIVVNANHFEENQDALHCIDSFNLTMNGNNVDDHLRDGVVIENTYGSVVSGNMLEECNGRAIVLDRDCYGITLSANVIAHNSGGGIDLRDAWGCAVSANTFVLDGVQALTIGSNSGRIAVTGNNFTNSHIGQGTRRLGDKDQSTGILLAGTSDITITGNIFAGLTNEAVKADAQCRRIVLAGNILADMKRAPDQPPALNLGGASEVVTSANLLDGPEAAPGK